MGEKKTPTDVVEVGHFFAGGEYSNPVQEKRVQDSPIADGDPSLLLPSESNYTLGDGPATATSASLTRRMRPAQGGFSCGHYLTGVGTIATCCYDLDPFPSMPQRYYILSTNSAIASLNDARAGDPILQPVLGDGGMYPSDMIARLTRYVTIEFSTDCSQPVNYVDAAIAEGNLQDLNRKIYWGGHVKDLYTTPSVNDIVQKSGRTTGFTTGRVTTINTTLDMNYSNGRKARFEKQIIATGMSNEPGDSGSLVLNLDEHAVGLISGGSSTATIINNILFVQALLKVRVHEK